MMTGISREQALLLAGFVASIRPDWDAQGVFKFIGEAYDKGDVWRVSIATIRAASNLDNRTPAVIPLNGDHWLTGQPGNGPSVVPDIGGLCVTCSHDRNRCTQAQQASGDTHTFMPSGRVLEVAREVLGSDHEPEQPYDPTDSTAYYRRQAREAARKSNAERAAREAARDVAEESQQTQEAS